jgi:hypothetical protein
VHFGLVTKEAHMHALESIDLLALVTVTGGDSSTGAGATVTLPGGAGGSVNYTSTEGSHEKNLAYAEKACGIIYPNTGPFTADPRKGTCMLDEMHRLTNSPAPAK